MDVMAEQWRKALEGVHMASICVQHGLELSKNL